jgi:broad specificity phosphatase PhoE
MSDGGETQVMTVHLVRHARPDWDLACELHWGGPAVDLVPLSLEGVTQAHDAAERLRGVNAARVIASPMPRALETAAIIARVLGLPLSVDFDLREWLPHTRFSWWTLDDVRAAYADMLAKTPKDGAAPEPEPPHAWEPLERVRLRATAAMRRHVRSTDETVIVVCHQVVIFALTGEEKTPLAGSRRIELARPSNAEG